MVIPCDMKTVPQKTVPEEKIAMSTTPNYQWVEVSPHAAFAPRDGAGALVFAGKMWLLGGWNPKDMTHFPRMCNNEVWSSENGADWNLVKPNTFHSFGRTFNRLSDWAGRHTAGYVVYKDKMWIVGGDVNQGHYHRDVWNSEDGLTWKYVNPRNRVPWGLRALHHTLVFKNKIWVMGGQTSPQIADADEQFYDDVWCTEDGINWIQMEQKEPHWEPRGAIGGNVVFKDRIWILGGATYSTAEHPERILYNDVWNSADGMNWECHLRNAPWNPRIFHDVAVFDNRMWVLEGAGLNGNQNDVWYSEDGVHWHELPGTPWKPRHAASVFVHQNALWMVAGNNMQPDVWKLTRT